MQDMELASWKLQDHIDSAPSGSFPQTDCEMCSL